MEFRRVLFRSDRKSTRLNSSHTLISYVVLSLDRKSTRLNSSHTLISYAVFCLTKKKKKNNTQYNIMQLTKIPKSTKTLFRTLLLCTYPLAVIILRTPRATLFPYFFFF